MARKGTPSAMPDHHRPSRSDHVLVVGCGYLGRNMVRGLSAARPVTVLSRRTPPAEVRAVARVVQGDAADRATLREAMGDAGHVVWCAGGLMPHAAERDPQGDAAATLGPLRTLVEVLRGRDAPTLTYLSSGGTVYGDPTVVPVSEDAPTRPIGAYGRVRLDAERLLLTARSADGLPVRVLRCANVYGGDQPADRGQGAVAVFLDRVARGEPVVLYDEGRAVRDFVHVDDVVHAASALLDRDGDPVLNVGSGRGVSVAELLALVEERLGLRADVVQRPGRSFDVARIVLDISRLQRAIAFRPRDLETGLRATRAPAPSERTPE